MAPKSRFNDGEKVLCFHGPLLYEAKCIKSQIKEKIVKYFIHYSGWNKNWDEWVPESRVLKYNDANMQKQKELEAAHGRLSLQDGIVEPQQGKKRSHGSSLRALKSSGVKKSKKAKTVKSSSKKDSTDRESSALPPQEKTPKQKGKEAAPAPTPPAETQSEIQRKKRTRAEINVETEEDFMNKVEVKVRVPDELKHWLVDDWVLINHEKKLFQLPARVTVDAILAEYTRQRLSVKGISTNKIASITETCGGIKDYFNAMLPKVLLYNFERPQHNEIMLENPDATPVQLYGAIHLLRFFSKLGNTLAYTALDEEGIGVLLYSLYDFAKFLSRNQTNLFSIGDYVPATPEYLRKVG